MALQLETLQPGTSVFVGASRIGEIRGVYADGASRAVTLLAVTWIGRDTLVAVSASDVESIDANGVTLIGGEPQSYENLPPFDAEGLTTIHEIAPTE